MRVLVIDDEPLARSLLRRMLEREGVQIVGEAEEAASGLALAEELLPDLVFLDVRMPGISGVEATGRFAQLEPAPLVILVTGFSEYAVEAFGKSALDYILKPVSAERLSVALLKARRMHALQRKARQTDALRRIARQSPLQRLPVRVKGSVRLLRIEKIQYAMASGKSVLIKTRDEDIRTSYTLSHLESILPSNFMRIHASCIVNLAVIEEVVLLGNHSYSVKLTSGEELPLGRLQYPKLQERLGWPAGTTNGH